MVGNVKLAVSHVQGGRVIRSYKMVIVSRFRDWINRVSI